jgi:hypothetical protein
VPMGVQMREQFREGRPPVSIADGHVGDGSDRTVAGRGGRA